MKNKYLEGLCLKASYQIFGEVVEKFNHSHDYETIEEMKEYAYTVVEQRYKKEEQELIKDNLHRLFNEYKIECKYHDMVYR